MSSLRIRDILQTGYKGDGRKSWHQSSQSDSKSSKAVCIVSTHMHMYPKLATKKRFLRDPTRRSVLCWPTYIEENNGNTSKSSEIKCVVRENNVNTSKSSEMECVVRENNVNTSKSSEMECGVRGNNVNTSKSSEMECGVRGNNVNTSKSSEAV